MKKVLKDYKKAMLPFVMSMANLLFMHYYFVSCGFYVGKMFAFTPILNLIFVAFDVFVLLLLYNLITWGHLKLSLHLCFTTTLLWSFFNVFYSRFFYQCLNLSAIMQISSLADGVVIYSAIGGFKWSDSFFLLSLILYILLSKCISFSRRIKLKGFLILLFCPIMCFIISLILFFAYQITSPKFKNHPELFADRVSEYLFNPFVWKSSMPVNVHFISGSIRYIADDIADEMTVYTLTDADKSLIKKEYLNHEYRETHNPVNKNIKNVIFILLESFLSSSSEMIVDGKEITPFLNKLRKDSTIYYNGKIQPNITIGESGDGQLIYMSGLLPLRNKISVSIAKHCTLRGLPQILKDKFGIKYTEIIIPSSPVVWEQRYMNERYGIDYMVSAVEAEGIGTFLTTEEKVFSLAKSTGKETKQPFFSMVLGISTHQPYDSPVDKNFKITDNSLSEHYRNYLIDCHYVDQQIEKYFEFLHKNDIYNNSLIIIASDHHPHIDQLNMKEPISTDLPLYIVNSGANTERMYHGTANQLDVFTTILDILDIDSDWLGLGHTLLSPVYHNSVVNSKYELSEKIILGNYFSLKPAE